MTMQLINTSNYYYTLIIEVQCITAWRLEGGFMNNHLIRIMPWAIIMYVDLLTDWIEVV